MGCLLDNDMKGLRDRFCVALCNYITEGQKATAAPTHTIVPRLIVITCTCTLYTEAATP